MIRPFTIATFLLATGSGLYLYQSKHEVQLLDRTIEKTLHDTSALREQSRLLSAEWTMLNDPERLRQFSDTYLSLRSINPAQFSSLADLDAKLPAPLEEVPASSVEGVPIAVQTEPRAVPEPASATIAAEEALPVPPMPALRAAPPVAPVGRPAEVKVASSRPVGAEAQARGAAGDPRGDARGDAQARAVSDPRPLNQRAPEQRASPRVEETRNAARVEEPRTAARVEEPRTEIRTPSVPPPRPIVLGAPKPQPAYAPASTPPAPAGTPPAALRPAMPPAAPYSGSLLGMAHGSMPPAPRPTPVNATYNAN